jgi:hypothetical protein
VCVDTPNSRNEGIHPRSAMELFLPYSPAFRHWREESPTHRPSDPAPELALELLQDGTAQLQLTCRSPAGGPRYPPENSELLTCRKPGD